MSIKNNSIMKEYSHFSYPIGSIQNGGIFMIPEQSYVNYVLPNVIRKYSLTLKTKHVQSTIQSINTILLMIKFFKELPKVSK